MQGWRARPYLGFAIGDLADPARFIMPTDLPSKPTFVERAIQAYNPGITFLVAVWVAGYATRQYLEQRGILTQLRDEALLSLIYVVPLMLIGWGLLTLFDPRRTKPTKH